MAVRAYFDRLGQEIDLARWAALLEDDSYRVVEQTDLGDGRSVSTIWLGLSPSPLVAPQLIFETQVRPSGEHLQRYASEAAAREGHRHLVDHLAAGEGS